MTSTHDSTAGDPKWGLVATIKAPVHEILNFAAYHLESGAHRLYLYLDEENPEAFSALKSHPKIRVTTCNERHWKRVNNRRPVKHQVRQAVNATHAYHRRAEVDWLIHMDVDEFLWSETPIAQPLATLPANVTSARIRPIEQLSGDGTAFKAHIPAGSTNDAVLARLYPTYGEHVKGGFLSHVQGKVFVRTGLEGIELRIHSVFQDGTRDPDQVELPGLDLCHCHAPSWEYWQRSFQYRLDKGAYRAELSPARPRKFGGVTLHDLLSQIRAEAGTAGLRDFFEEICLDTPELRQRLEKEGLLKIRDLNLDALRRKHFPEY